jgi:hypothetical protein
VVITTATLAAFLHPSTFDPATLFEPIEQGVKRCRMKSECPLRSLFDQLSNFVTMTGRPVKQGQEQELGAPLLPFAIDSVLFHMYDCHILRSDEAQHQEER